ncbi:hypothetical protein AVEN_260142-1 [Araneus ventricosus]|uniref:Uncharacterized protein n=1 Tax=Araneus ventricosus TaxID=182803 RepID=A0A4Y2DGP1_ARAVE|nr:hypothetical protein AVEN_260142-1 [Araneus ventricosus]
MVIPPITTGKQRLKQGEIEHLRYRPSNTQYPLHNLSRKIHVSEKVQFLNPLVNVSKEQAYNIGGERSLMVRSTHRFSRNYTTYNREGSVATSNRRKHPVPEKEASRKGKLLNVENDSTNKSIL